MEFGGHVRTKAHLDLTDANDESLRRWKESLGLGSGNTVSDPNDPRTVVILSLALEVEGRDDIVVDVQTATALQQLKDKPFTIKEGARYRMKITFRVQHQVLSGLKYLQSVKRKGIRVGKDEEMIVRPSSPPLFLIEPQAVAIHHGSPPLTVCVDRGLTPLARPTNPTTRSNVGRHLRPAVSSSRATRLHLPRADFALPTVATGEAPTGMMARGHYDAVSKFVDDDKVTHLQFEWAFDIKKDW